MLMPNLTSCRTKVGHACGAPVKHGLAGHEVGLAVGAHELTSRDDYRGVEVPAVVLLDDAEHERRHDRRQPLQHGGEPRRVEAERVLTHVLLVHEIALQEALRKQQQINALRVGLRREVLNAQQR